MDEVPDLRAFGTRIAHCVVALALGLVSALEIAMRLPEGHGREASAFAPLFLVLGMGGAFAVGWYALLDALRRSGPYPRSRVLQLPVARAWRRGSRARGF